MKKRNRILVALLAAISVLTAGCSGEIEQNPIGLEQEESQAEASADASESTTENEKAPDMLASQKKLYNQNKDTIGWIEVPGTSVDNVIVQKKDEAENEKNTYYLDKDFSHQKFRAGTVFMDYRDVFGYKEDEFSENLVLYGHNMADNTMFGSLRRYRQDLEFYKDAPFIKLSSNYKEYEYVILFYNSTNFEIIKNVTTIVKKAIENGYDQNDIQVLAPIYQGVAGINALNLALQEIFNPKNHQEEYRIGQKVYREGDKILQLKNRPDDDIYNGDIGVLVEINRKDGFEYLEDTLIVDYDGNLVEYTSKDFMTFTLAYCMSIHKAQGNEFKIVIMPVLNDYYIMLKRNLIYTGLTRAKQALFILGNPQAFLYGIKNISDSKRKTTLVSKINQNKNVETYEESSYNQELKQNITDFLNDDETV